MLDDAVGVLLHAIDNGPNAPYTVPCAHCEWRDSGEWEPPRDDQYSYAPDGAICPVCKGTGLEERAGIDESPWVIDSFTRCCAEIDRMWIA